MNTTQGRVLHVNGNEGGYTRPAIQGPVRNVPAPKDEKREYFPIDITSFPEAQQAKYNRLRELMQEIAMVREDFEGDMTSIMVDNDLVNVPKGREIVYWYRYGLLNISYDPIKVKTAAKKPNAITFNK